VLSGKARGRQVFGRGRATDRHRNVATIFLLQLPVRLCDLLAEIIPVGSGIDDRARGRGASGKIGDPPLVDAGEQRAQLVPRTGFGQGVSECRGRQRKAVRDLDALRRQYRI